MILVVSNLLDGTLALHSSSLFEWMPDVSVFYYFFKTRPEDDQYVAYVVVLRLDEKSSDH